jgi:hypothetical protein
MSIRVVVLAEGSKETGAITLRPKSGIPLTEDQLGPAHVLVRRCLTDTSGAPEAAIRLIEPHRLGTGAVARGSNLLAWQCRNSRRGWLQTMLR